jgi:hypothetical protein
MPTQIDAASRFPISEPSVLTFDDLVREVAIKIGVPYYGSTGTDVPSSPVNVHDLFVCKRLVNDAIRMLINDAPPSGWRWARPIASVILYPAIYADSTGASYVTTSYSSTTSTTTLTLTSATQSFYPTMELRKIWLGGDTSTGTPFVVASYQGPTTMAVYGAVSSTIASTSSAHVQFSMEASDFTLPANFGGQCYGVPTYAKNTNRMMSLAWTDESQIRGYRQNQVIDGVPSQLAIRPISLSHYQDIANVATASTVSFPRWRWELMAWPQPSEVLTIQLPYLLYFQELVSTADRPPTPFFLDEPLKAACLACGEQYKGDSIEGSAWQYYQHALAQGHQADARMAPRTLGKLTTGRVEPTNWRDLITRPIITP